MYVLMVGKWEIPRNVYVHIYLTVHSRVYLIFRTKQVVGHATAAMAVPFSSTFYCF